MSALEHHLLRSKPPDGPITSIEAWFARIASCPYEEPLQRALWSGFEADRLGYAFAGGYHAALGRLVDHARLPEAKISLAATESGGAHPRAIETRLDGVGAELRLRGEKTFATLASVADE